MTGPIRQPQRTKSNSPACYRKWPTHVLMRRIALRADRAALDEFHNYRRVFRFKNGPPLLLVEYVNTVFNEEPPFRFFGLPTSVLDQAYNLTIDKFSVLPIDQVPAHDGLGETDNPVKRNGPDCRHYFKAISRAIALWQNRHPQADALTLEAATAQIVQCRVACHCWWSCLEASRALRSAWSRFTWNLPTGTIAVWMPRRLSGPQRGAWLESHVPTPEPERPDENRRVQAIIDGYFGASEVIPFDESAHTASSNRATRSVLDILVEHEVAVQGLAHFVAREKSLRIAEQRPSISRLGSTQLTKLILRVFEDLEAECLKDHVIAEAFGLSRPTYSRFAGSEGTQNNDGRLADLWLNVALVVASVPAFREVAEELGVWNRVQKVLNR